MIKNKLNILFLTYLSSYFVTFFSIIGKGFLTLEFIIYFIINLIIFSNMKKIYNLKDMNITKFSSFSMILLIPLHIITSIFGGILGPTKKVIHGGILNTTNESLMLLNIIIIIIIFITYFIYLLYLKYINKTKIKINNYFKF